MNYLNKMYGRQPKQTQSSDGKNPARVSGGLKGQGVDHLVMVAEDGSESQVPTQRYVQSLEDQVRKQRAAINVLERKLTRVESNISTLESHIRRNQ